MADKIGNLAPFRISKDHLIDLASRLNDKLPSFPEEPLPDDWRFWVTIGKYSDQCVDMKHLESFLGHISLPNAVDEFSLVVSSSSGALDPYEGPYPSVTLDCSRYRARYSIKGAVDVDQANALEDIVVGFHERHKSSFFFRPVVGFWLESGLALAVFMDVLYLTMCSDFYQSSCSFWSQYRVWQIMFIGFSLIALAYIEWSNRASDMPSYSFRHTILYMDKESKNSAIWAVIAGIVIDVVVAVAVQTIFT